MILVAPLGCRSRLVLAEVFTEEMRVKSPLKSSQWNISQVFRQVVPNSVGAATEKQWSAMADESVRGTVSCVTPPARRVLPITRLAARWRRYTVASSLLRVLCGMLSTLCLTVAPWFDTLVNRQPVEFAQGWCDMWSACPCSPVMALAAYSSGQPEDHVAQRSSSFSNKQYTAIIKSGHHQ